MSKPFTTVLDEAFADYKLHHKDLDYCFNDAVAVHHVQQTILTAVEQLVTEVIATYEQQEPVNLGYHGDARIAQDARTRLREQQRQRLAALLRGNKA